MRTRYALVDEILRTRTYDAVIAALDHVMNCLRLCRSDNMGGRDVVPALLLRLDRDQECYDSLKWCATTGQESDYDRGDLDELFLDLKDMHVLESPTFNQIEESDTQNSRGDYQHPVELIKVLKTQVNMLHEAIDKANELFWPALMAPGSHLEARPPLFSHGSEAEIQLSGPMTCGPKFSERLKLSRQHLKRTTSSEIH
ncbi:hypothetical protein MMC29_001433 [Sticta canariensis]|nr:hypothetical protein [Sticta canariensis]